MAVNVSARSLEHGSTLPDLVAELTRTSAIPPGRLTLELTEGALIEAAAPDVLDRLHEMGQRVSIDDFGTGYSSLTSLRDMPVDILKIDKSFVDHIVSSADSARLVRMILQLARDLGMRTVAEGVEELSQLEALREMGCHLIQGYYFSKPLPAGELQTLLQHNFVVLENS
jgi:EAL domain-containing protein (putative c-di-GMP-specific phosphodiesterase class I)